MSDPDLIFKIFNWVEACIWFAVAFGLLVIIRFTSRKQRICIFAASVGFVLFGITDLLEAPTHGLVPTWLWAFKISTATLLLGCRVIYVGREKFRQTDRWLVFGVICFVVSVFIIGAGAGFRSRIDVINSYRSASRQISA